jgi:lysyl-tRNA synthetase class 2
MILLWSRFGRWRLLTRSLGMVLAQALVVLTIGLIANRSEEFYPSWQALSGDTGTTEATAPRPAGRLDATLAGGQSSVPWRPADLASWRLALTPTVVLPVGYRDRPSTAYPVVLVLTANAAEASAAASVRTDGVVTVVATPTAATRVAALGRLGADLGGDVRVSGYGWGLVASAREALLAAALVDGAPGRFVGEALIGSGPRPHGSVPVALVKAVAGAKPGPSGTSVPPAGPTPSSSSVPPSGPTPSGSSVPPSGPTPSGKPSPSGKAARPKRSPKKPSRKPASPRKPKPSKKSAPPRKPTAPGIRVPHGTALPPAPVVNLTCAPVSVWTVAAKWAAGQTSEPLQPPVQLPVGAHPAGGPPAGGAPRGGHSVSNHPVAKHSAPAHRAGL